jgi:hypothetical protein
MSPRLQLPDTQWWNWTRNASLRTGVLAGIYLSCAFVAWLVVANRVPELEAFAGVRNLAAAVVMILLMAIPVLRFRFAPMRLFVAGLVAWTLMTITYRAAELFFSLLESRLGALHVFMLGAVSYGFVAVFEWVALICVEARSRHVAQTQEPSASTGRARTD